ncbi:hypothetical protein PREVCOP_06576 [Segatella copri DSM 18205]|uniref:Uncharacterized protein n=1 Tax=Segatella copri DSM 18205 TaxID=537011 RepID=D1PH56_9BACT|nr:hypothetical protein PREVCOP_06576 [Segatella copri DSM 18205]
MHRQLKKKITFYFVSCLKGSTFAPRMPKAGKAKGFELLIIYKHFI